MDHGLDIKLLIAMSLSVLLLSIQLASALDIVIGVNEEINANVFDMNVISGPPQKYTVRWSNTGSTDCRSRLRVDMLDAQGRRAFTAWSGLERLPPSQEAASSLYSNLPPGQYTLVIRIYHCNEVFEQGPVNILVDSEITDTGTIEMVSYSVNDGLLEVSLRSTQDLENVAVVPEGFPVGWVFTQGFIDSLPAGETRTVTMPFEPSLWVDRKITLSAFTEDGKDYGEGEVVIRKPEPFQDNSHLYLLVVVIAVIAIISFLYYTRIRLLWKRQ